MVWNWIAAAGPRWLDAVWHCLEGVLFKASRIALALVLVFTTAYATGWLHRLILFIIERETSKVLNGAPVTIGSIRLDLWRGRFHLTNLLIHSPQRAAWHWSSPIIARVGYAYVEINIVYVLLSLWFLWEEPPLDIATVHASDIQGFVERQHQVFNFFLLDPNNILPDPSTLPPPTPASASKQSQPLSSVAVKTMATKEGLELSEAATEATTISSLADASSALEHHPSAGESKEDDGENDESLTSETDAASSAEQVVQDVLNAVQSLRVAAQQGSLHGALSQQKEHLTTRLRDWQMSDKKKTTSQSLEQGVKLVQQITDTVVQKTQGVQQGVLPARRPPPKDDKIVYARFGRLIVQEAHIFLRDDEDWKPPLYLKHATVRAAEFSPPLSMLDDPPPDGGTAWPALYQPLPNILDVVWKSLLADIAKAHTGELLNTALGEVLAIWLSRPDGEKSG